MSNDIKLSENDINSLALAKKAFVALGGGCYKKNIDEVFGNPLLNDTDAINLASSLRISLHLSIDGCEAISQCREHHVVEFKTMKKSRINGYSPIRTAIVRLAAEIGKTLP